MVNWFAVLMYLGVCGSALLADKTGHWQWIFGAAGTELAGIACGAGGGIGLLVVILLVLWALGYLR